MQFLGRDAHFAAETKFTAIGEAGGSVDIYRGAIHQGGKAGNCGFIFGNDGIGMAGGMCGWFLMDVSDGEKPMMVFVPDTHASNTPTISDVRLISGTQDQILRMPFPAHSVFAKGSTLYGFSGSNVMIGSIDSEVLTAYQLPMSVSDVAGVTDDNVAVIDSNNTYYLVALQ